MLVEKLKDEKEWEQFVAGAPGGTFYHTIKWKKILENAFSYQTEYLVIRDDSGDLTGVCPFAVTNKLRLLRILDSLPESDFGGPLVTESGAATALEALNDYLQVLCREKGITYAKIRCPNETSAKHFRAKGMTVDTSSGSMNLDLDQKPPDFIWNEVWTFHDRGKEGVKEFFKRMGKFNLVSIIGLILNVAILMFLNKVFGIYPLTANIVGIAVAFIWNFAANNLWTWYK